MGMTMTQKILAAHAGLESVTAGQLIEAKLDIVMANDITGPMALPILKQMADQVFDKEKVVFVPDHFTPNKDIKSAENSKAIREFAKEQGPGAVAEELEHCVHRPLVLRQQGGPVQDVADQGGAGVLVLEDGLHHLADDLAVPLVHTVLRHDDEGEIQLVAKLCLSAKVSV